MAYDGASVLDDGLGILPFQQHTTINKQVRRSPGGCIASTSLESHSNAGEVDYNHRVSAAALEESEVVLPALPAAVAFPEGSVF